MTLSIAYIRGETSKSLACQSPGCGGRLFITPSGMLVCEHGHGRLLPLSPIIPGRFSLADLRRAWPELVIEPPAGREKDFKNRAS